MDSEKIVIRYNYIDRQIGTPLIDHIFRYISAVTGLKFVADSDSPDVEGGDFGHSSRAKVVLTDDSANIRDSRLVTPDPIKFLARASAGDLTNESYKVEFTAGELIENLTSALAATNLIPESVKPVNLWPEKKRFCAVFSHDVDIIRRSVTGSAKLLFMKSPPGGFKGLKDSIRSRIGNFKNPYDKISEWLERERKLGIVSTWFVFAGDRRDTRDPKYGPSDISESLKAINTAGDEIALHSSIGCDSGKYLTESKKVLESCTKGKIRGTRPHYLSARLPEYWEISAQSGFSYTSVLGSDTDIGHPYGVDLPIIPFDKSDSKAIEIVELPITIMDCGLIGDKNADSDSVFERACQLVDDTVKTGGVITLDWHQRTLYEPDYPGWGELYFKIAEYILNKTPHIDTMEGVAGLLKKRFEGAN